MKLKFFFVGALLGGLTVTASATSLEYVNYGVVAVPPASYLDVQIDATNFVNNNYFSVNFANQPVAPYTTSATRRYTNNGVMICNSGFRFDTQPVSAGAAYMADYFVNNGTVLAGSALNTNTLFANYFFQLGWPRYQISATNISLRSSSNITGVDGLFKLNGKRVDLNRANITMEGFEENPDSLGAVIDMVGMTADYWGLGQNIMNPVFQFETAPVTSPPTFVQTAAGGFGVRTLVLPNATFYFTQTVVGTNREFRGVFINNTNTAIINRVYFPTFGTTMVEWNGFHTNPVSGVVTTNRMYLTDTAGSFATNFLAGNFSYYSLLGTAIPNNYNFTRFNPFLAGQLFPATATSPAGVFDSVVITNDAMAFSGLFAPTTLSIASLPPSGRYTTNLPGRIEINADSTLDLSSANITALNYLSLRATNHLISSSGAKITAPFSDINLASTNGMLAITNLLEPYVQRFTGQVDLWTGRWTNDGAGFQTRYVVLLVDTKLNVTAPAQIENLALRSTNVTISDILNVTKTLLIDAQSLTITSNQQPAQTRTGEINLLSANITWPNSMPRLQFLTNSGIIKSLNAVLFGGARNSPYYTSNFNEMYEAFVNRGTVSTEGTLIWSKYFENTGSFDTGLGFGSITLESLDTRLTNGSFIAINGDISLTTASLITTNHVLQAGRKLTLTVTNLLTDTGVTNANIWSVGRGFNLPIKPVSGDLAGTIITETAAVGIENTHLWAAHDLGGTNSAGFQNNAVVGKVILDAQGPTSTFSFTGAGSNNAIYIDYLELRNYATNINQSGIVTGFEIDTNIVVYYAQAMANGISVAERINHANGDRLRWAFNHHSGLYSSTNLVYPDGSTNSFNTALVLSQNIDSDNDGLVNAVDPTPILIDLGMTVAMTTQPLLGAQVSWRTVPGSENTVYYRTSTVSPTWLVLTNFTTGPFVGERVNITDPVVPGGGRYYRVKMTPPQP